MVVDLTDDARRRARTTWVVVCGVLVVGLIAVGSSWPLLTAQPVIGFINVMVAVSFAATGILLSEERQQRATGLTLVASAAFYLASWWWSWPPDWLIGPLPLISYVCGYLWFVLGVLALLRYPEPALARRWDRVYVLVLGGWVVGSKCVLALFSRPEWVSDPPFPAGAWWPTLAPDRELFDRASRFVTIGIVVLAVLVIVPLLLKVRRSRGIDRIDAVPGVVAAATVMICGSAYLLAKYGSFAGSTVDVLRAVIGVAALFTPLAFLTSALRRRLARSSLADLLVRLVDSPTGRDLQEQLRRSLPDPTLTVWFWLPREQVYIDVEDLTAAAVPDDGRWPVQVVGSDGQLLAVLVLDGTLRRHPSLVAPAVAACSFALENYRLQAELRGRLQEVQRSRARIAAAELKGRQQIERDLHDGAQQTLIAASASLGMARHQAAPGTPVFAAIEQARADVRTATDELRRLARGIHPPLLTQSGLRPSLDQVVARLSVPATIDVPDQRFPAAVETTAYFVVCEALTNAVRHANAHDVHVLVQPVGDRLTVSVSDDGSGGAQLSGGSGLAA